MNSRVLFFLAYLLFGISPNYIFGQQTCVEIKDKLNLPQKTYEELKDYKAILIGEMHGTNEAPQYAEGMVNLWLNRRQKVLLGLEINGDEQSRIDSFLSTGDSSIIRKSPFFNQRTKYGTSSVAMFNLIKSCYGKPDLKITCLDITNYRKTRNKDSMMAVCINNTLRLYPASIMITLTGNIHNKLDSNQFGKPTGYWLYKMPNSILNRNEIASVDVVFDTGTAWCCQPDCGIHNESVSSTWITDECKYDSFFKIYENGIMVLFTKAITASLPLNP